MNNINNKPRYDDYVLIQGYMVSKYNLQGVDLIVYAIIDNYCQTPSHWYKVDDTKYFEAWTGASSDEILMSLYKMVQRGLLLHNTEITDDKRMINLYRTA